MKKITGLFFLVGLACLCMPSFSQSHGGKNCMYVAPVYSEKVAAYGIFDDSMNRLIATWEKSCGTTEPLLRLKLLKALETNDVESIEKLLSEYYPHYFFIYKFKVESARNGELSENDLKRSLPSFGYVPIGSHFDKWIRSLVPYPSGIDIQTADAMDAARLLLSESPKDFAEAMKKSHDESLAKVKESAKKRAENKVALCLSATGGVWVPFGKIRTFDPAFFLNYGIGVKYRKNSIEAFVGDMDIQKTGVVINTQKLNYPMDGMLNYNLVAAHRFDLKQNREIELGIGGGGSSIRTNELKSALNPFENMIRLTVPAAILRTRFYYNFNPQLRIGLEFKYQFADYNKARSFDLPIGQNYLYIGIVLRY